MNNPNNVDNNKFELHSSKKPLNKDEISYLLQKIDRKLKFITTDPEIAGQQNIVIQSPDFLPLTLSGVDSSINALGSLTAHEIINQLEQRTESTLSQRQIRYERLHEAQQHPEIAGALNIYADEATTEDQNGDIFHILHPNQEVIQIIKDLFERIGIHDKAWHIIRNMCGFGDDFYEIVISRNLKKILKIIKIPRQLVVRIEKNGELIGFKITGIENLVQTTAMSYSVRFTTQQEKQEDIIYPFRILHFRIPSEKYGVYGEGVIDSVLSTIEQLQIMERALLIARVTRAPERRIFYIDVGTLQGEAAIKYTKQVMDSFRNKKRLDYYTKNRIDLSRDIFGATEDIAIPKRAGTEGNRIDTLPQLNNFDTQDLEWIRDKIFPGLSVPRQYLYDENVTNSNLNLSSKSTIFAKRVRRIQRYFLQQLYKLAYIELRLQGYNRQTIEQLVILMNNPSTIDERERLEIESNKWQLITSMKGLNAETIFVPDYIIYKNILKLSDQEILQWMKLSQLQAAGQNIFEAFPIEERPEGYQDLVNPKEIEQEQNIENIEGTEEGGEKEGEQGIPMDVITQLGPPPTPSAPSPQAGAEKGGPEGEGGIPPTKPPTPENAEYTPETPEIYTLTQYNEILKKKYNFIKLLYEHQQQNTYNEQLEKINELQQQNVIGKYVKPLYSLEELEICGEFRGFNEVYDTIYTPNTIED